MSVPPWGEAARDEWKVEGEQTNEYRKAGMRTLVGEEVSGFEMKEKVKI